MVKAVLDEAEPLAEVTMDFGERYPVKIVKIKGFSRRRLRPTESTFTLAWLASVRDALWAFTWAHNMLASVPF